MTARTTQRLVSGLPLLTAIGLILGSLLLLGAGQQGATTQAKPRRAPGVPATLRAAAEAGGLLVGTAVSTPALAEGEYRAILAREFNYLTPENAMKWGPLHPEPEKWNFSAADELVAFARAHEMRVKGHTLVWHQQLPAYVNDKLTREELRAVLVRHIQRVVTHYRGKVFAWDVVNEAVDDTEGLRKSIFLEKLGEGYIAEAFRLAHAADPKALLFYNDYGAEGLGPKSDRVYELLKRLRADGVPVHGVGLQMHIDATDFPKPAEITANIQRLRALGLLVNISEMDVRITKVSGGPNRRLQVQRDVYRNVIAAGLRRGGIHAVTFWGFTDAHSWIDGHFGPDDPLLFDETYRPKPAYEGVMAALRMH